MSNIVEARNVSKRFGAVTALDGVSLDIAPGAVVGLIGRNGAGKTTLLRSILGLTGFTGEMFVLGQDPRRGRHKVMRRACFIADVGVLPRWLKVADAVRYLEGVHPAFNRHRAETMLADNGIGPDRKVRQLSKGMVTQLHLALVMAIEVDLLALDEPTLGLDIFHRKAFYEELLDDRFDRKVSVVISTHQVEEVESLLTHLLFIDHGRIVLDLAMDDLPEVYSEIDVKPEHQARAAALMPIHTRELAGRQTMIFERVAKDRLEEFGDVRTPGLADLFVARMQAPRPEHSGRAQ